MMRENTLTIAWRFGAVVVVAVLVLGILNALPQFLGGEPLGVVRYATLDEAEARLGASLYRPAKLPDRWRWPPSRIRFAVGRPDWIEFVFEATGGGGAAAEGGQAAGGKADGAGAADTPLILCQTLGSPTGDAQVAPVLLPPGELLEAADVSIDGRAMRMQRVLAAEGTIVHELWWRDEARRVMLRGRVPADDLPRIARVMLGDGK